VRSTRASRRSVIAIAGTVQAHSAVWPTCGSSGATAARVPPPRRMRPGDSSPTAGRVGATTRPRTRARSADRAGRSRRPTAPGGTPQSRRPGRPPPAQPGTRKGRSASVLARDDRTERRARTTSARAPRPRPSIQRAPLDDSSESARIDHSGLRRQLQGQGAGSGRDPSARRRSHRTPRPNGVAPVVRHTERRFSSVGLRRGRLRRACERAGESCDLGGGGRHS
jgi:hypothetical protein